MPIKSRTCTGAVSKAPLTEYASEHEACAGTDYAFERHGSAMVPYLCDRCHCWHLSPHDRQTRASTCTACIGRDGRPKARYDSKEAAARRLEILRHERHVSLRVYPCPHGGWHLTKAGSLLPPGRSRGAHARSPQRRELRDSASLAM